jgi:hypothetical protein
MKIRNIIYGIIISLTTISCTSDDEQNKVVFGKAYIKIFHKVNDFCVGTLLITDGSANPNNLNNGIQVNTDSSNAISFDPISFENCEISYPFSGNFNRQNGDNLVINTLLPPIVSYEAKFRDNGFPEYLNEYYANHLNIIYAQLNVNSSTEINFEIRYENGDVISNSFSGKIEINDISD